MALEQDLIYLNDLRKGDLVRAIAGDYKYDFLVEQPGERPAGTLSLTNPDGSVVSPVWSCSLEGVGRYLTNRENPVQEYRLPGQEQITISYGMLFAGGKLMLIDPNEPIGRRVELRPVITEIQVYPDNPGETFPRPILPATPRRRRV